MLQEKQLSPDKLSLLDDEVPFADGVSSPNNTPSRKPSTSTASTPSQRRARPSDLPFPEPSVLESDVPTSSLGAVAGETTASASVSPTAAAALEHSRASSLDRTNNVPASPVDTAIPASPLMAEPSPASAVVELADRLTSPSVDANVSVPSFDYAGSSKSGYWSTTESTRTLHAKLSELRVAVPEEEEPNDHSEQ